MTLTKQIHPSLLQRKIIHIDMDCFYAAVEVRDNPALTGRAVIVGGSPQSRAVVCTASYEARRFGVHSAMACSQAQRLCPQAIFIPPNFNKYRSVSQQLRQIFKRYTSKIEPLSLDEAYLDVSGHHLYATAIAKEIRAVVFAETGLTCSAGVAANKLLAKIASDIHKPNGITVVLPHQVEEFMRQLPLRRLPGVGPQTEKRLLRLGLKTCQDIWVSTPQTLLEQLGERLANWLLLRSRGIDERPVEERRQRKSLGCEETFAQDLLDRKQLQAKITELAEQVAQTLHAKKLSARSLTLKVKYADFKQITRSQTCAEVFSDQTTIAALASQLLTKTAAGERPIRLLGLTAAGLSLVNEQTLS